MDFRDKGENIAVNYLKKKGYKILENNFNGRGFEIDIIAIRGELISFVEVKRRKSSTFMSPLQSIDAKKKSRLVKGAKFFLQSNNIFDRCNVRFDVITITGKEEHIEHYEDAFRVGN